jgi:hypothetical protein
MRAIIISLFLAGLVSGQWTQGQDVSEENGNYFYYSNSDSVFWDDDTLYIAGAETAYVYVKTGRTLGNITFKGYVTVKDTMGHASDTASVVFDMAKLKGLSYTQPDDSVTETFYGLDSMEVLSGATAFYFYPWQNNNLDDSHVFYYILRIRSRAQGLAAIIIREERVLTY